MSHPAASDAIARMMATPTDAARVVDLSIGEPDQALPAPLVEAAIGSLRAGHTGYTAKLGIPALRRAIADDTHPDVDADDVVVTIGGTGAVAVALMTVGAEGIVIPDPAWPNYRVLADELGFDVHEYPQGTTGDGFFDLDAIGAALSAGARLVVANSPSNPTGVVASAKAWRELIVLVREHGAFILSDEAYESIVFSGGRAPSPIALGGGDVTFAARTFSKRFSMTGLRVGSLVSPPSFRVRVAAIHGTTAGCAPITAQEVALHALEHLPHRAEELAAIYRERFGRARDILGRRIGAVAAEDAGGFYLWIDVSDDARPSTRIASDLLEAGVAVSAGTVYSATDGHLRASLTAADDDLFRALERIRDELPAV
jgi:aspartate/methionine/tyrosine aminotransferase